jgi:Putative transposase
VAAGGVLDLRDQRLARRVAPQSGAADRDLPRLGGAPAPRLRKERRFSATYKGFDIHCAVRIEADDDEGRERLIRYCARPPFALERIEELKDGRIAYLMKTARRGSTQHVMTPMEFMGRLSILLPPPYYPDWALQRRLRRALVVARARDAEASRWRRAAEDEEEAVQRTDGERDACELSAGECILILDGELFATSSRVEWAVLLRRTHGLDALRCPKCEAKMRVIATLLDPRAVRKILTHLGGCADPLPRARARHPTAQTSFDFDFDAP